MTDHPLDLDALTRLRRDLHANPETAGNEAVTARRILRALEPLSPDETLTALGGHGVAALFKGDTDSPPVLIRCELDALPIPETINLPHGSLHPGVSHKCGHDGHMAIAIACAHLQRAHKADAKAGDAPTIALLFQPAEETGAGAIAVHADDRLDAWNPAGVIALHNLPGSPMASVLVREGTICTASVGLKMVFKGTTTHASTPELGVSPVPALARAAQRVFAIETPKENVEFITVTSLNAGHGDFGISPGEGELCVTARAETDGALDALVQQIEAIATDEAQKDGLSLEHSKHDHFPACVNDAAAIAHVREAAHELKMNTIELDRPIAFSEDVAHTINAYSGALFGLGSGEDQPPLHNVEYDFPDELIEPGARLLYETAKRLSQTR